MAPLFSLGERWKLGVSRHIEVMGEAVSGRLAKVAFAMAPIPFGSVETSWMILWIVVLALSLAFAPVPPRRGEATWITAVVVLCLVLVGLHSLLLVSPSDGRMAADPAWALARELDPSLVDRLSATRSNPLISLGPVVLAALAFLNGYTHAQSARRGQRILVVIAWSGLLIAVYGIASTLLDTRLILWREKTAYLFNVTGTFVNRNTAGTYFGSCSILWFLIAARRLELVWPGWGTRVRVEELLGRREMRSVYVAFAGFLVCFGALVMTGSRGGLVATMIGLVIVGAIYGRHVVTRIGWRWGGGALVFVCLALLLELLGGTLAGRIERDGLNDPLRLDTYGAMLTMIADHPLLGIGLGNFEALFPRYRPDTLLNPGVLDKAHNSWLEMLVSLGLPLGLALICLALWCGVALMRGSLARRDYRMLPLAGLGVGIVGSLHSLFDFSLQIPGYAVVFAAVLGCGLAQRHPHAG